MLANKEHRTGSPNRRDLQRYRKFAESYLAIGQPTYFNAKKSAIAAGYSDSYARGRSYELLVKVGVQEEIRRLRDERVKLSTIATPEEILEALTLQLRTLPNELMQGGQLIPLDQMTKEQAAAIAGTKIKTRNIMAGEDVITETTLEYKLVDRQKAAEMLAKHHGLFEKDNHQSKPDPTPLQLVAMPSGPLSLEEWTRQAQAILNGGRTEQLQKMQQLENKAAG